MEKVNKCLTVGFLTLFTSISIAQSCLYKNPLCFYNTDVLSYLKILHQNQQYEKMTPFFYGPYVSKMKRFEFITQLSEQDFGYSMKRVGIKEETAGNWSITYQRTILGTNNNFKIKCTLVDDTCRIYLDEKSWKVIFQ